MKSLSQQLGTLFSAPVRRRNDPFTTARIRAPQIATSCGVEIETVKGGGFNVWPPRSDRQRDPYAGDHYASDWNEVLVMVEGYLQRAAKNSTAPASRQPPTDALSQLKM